jgi:hypothetical protein
MHAFFQALFPFIVIIYLVDCIAGVRKGQLIFFSFVGSRFWWKQSGIFLLGLLPVSEVIAAQKTPLAFTRYGLYISSKNNTFNLCGVYCLQRYQSFICRRDPV